MNETTEIPPTRKVSVGFPYVADEELREELREIVRQEETVNIDEDDEFNVAEVIITPNRFNAEVRIIDK